MSEQAVTEGEPVKFDHNTALCSGEVKLWALHEAGKCLLFICKDHGDKLTGEHCPYCEIAGLEAHIAQLEEAHTALKERNELLQKHLVEARTPLEDNNAL